MATGASGALGPLLSLLSAPPAATPPATLGAALDTLGFMLLDPANRVLVRVRAYDCAALCFELVFMGSLACLSQCGVLWHAWNAHKGFLSCVIALACQRSTSGSWRAF
jgi:hypothetical protein